MKRLFALLLVGLIVSGLLFYQQYRQARKYQAAYQRLNNAAEHLQGDLVQMRSEQGQLLSENQVLSLRLNELNRFLPELHAELKNLKVKAQHSEQISRSAFAVEQAVETRLKDSIIYDTVPVKVFDYQDQHFRVKGLAQGTRQVLDLNYRDTLVQVVYRGPRKRPWLWIFSPRQLRQRVSLKNPNAQIYYSQVIDIQP